MPVTAVGLPVPPQPGMPGPPAMPTINAAMPAMSGSMAAPPGFPGMRPIGPPIRGMMPSSPPGSIGAAPGLSASMPAGLFMGPPNSHLPFAAGPMPPPPTRPPFVAVGSAAAVPGPPAMAFTVPALSGSASAPAFPPAGPMPPPPSSPGTVTPSATPLVGLVPQASGKDGLVDEPLAARISSVLQECKSRLVGRRKEMKGLKQERDFLARSLREAEVDFLRLGSDWRRLEHELEEARSILTPEPSLLGSARGLSAERAASSAKRTRSMEPPWSQGLDSGGSRQVYQTDVSPAPSQLSASRGRQGLADRLLLSTPGSRRSANRSAPSSASQPPSTGGRGMLGRLLPLGRRRDSTSNSRTSLRPAGGVTQDELSERHNSTLDVNDASCAARDAAFTLGSGIGDVALTVENTGGAVVSVTDVSTFVGGEQPSLYSQRSLDRCSINTEETNFTSSGLESGRGRGSLRETEVSVIRSVPPASGDAGAGEGSRHHGHKRCEKDSEERQRKQAANGGPALSEMEIERDCCALEAFINGRAEERRRSGSSIVGSTRAARGSAIGTPREDEMAQVDAVIHEEASVSSGDGLHRADVEMVSMAVQNSSHDAHMEEERAISVPQSMVRERIIETSINEDMMSVREMLDESQEMLSVEVSVREEVRSRADGSPPPKARHRTIMAWELSDSPEATVGQMRATVMGGGFVDGAFRPGSSGALQIPLQTGLGPVTVTLWEQRLGEVRGDYCILGVGPPAEGVVFSYEPHKPAWPPQPQVGMSSATGSSDGRTKPASARGEGRLVLGDLLTNEHPHAGTVAATTGSEERELAKGNGALARAGWNHHAFVLGYRKAAWYINGVPAVVLKRDLVSESLGPLTFGNRSDLKRGDPSNTVLIKRVALYEGEFSTDEIRDECARGSEDFEWLTRQRLFFEERQLLLGMKASSPLAVLVDPTAGSSPSRSHEVPVPVEVVGVAVPNAVAPLREAVQSNGTTSSSARGSLLGPAAAPIPCARPRGSVARQHSAPPRQRMSMQQAASAPQLRAPGAAPGMATPGSPVRLGPAPTPPAPAPGHQVMRMFSPGGPMSPRGQFANFHPPGAPPPGVRMASPGRGSMPMPSPSPGASFRAPVGAAPRIGSPVLGTSRVASPVQTSPRAHSGSMPPNMQLGVGSPPAPPPAPGPATAGALQFGPPLGSPVFQLGPPSSPDAVEAARLQAVAGPPATAQPAQMSSSAQPTSMATPSTRQLSSSRSSVEVPQGSILALPPPPTATSAAELVEASIDQLLADHISREALPKPFVKVGPGDYVYGGERVEVTVSHRAGKRPKLKVSHPRVNGGKPTSLRKFVGMFDQPSQSVRPESNAFPQQPRSSEQPVMLALTGSAPAASLVCDPAPTGLLALASPGAVMPPQVSTLAVQPVVASASGSRRTSLSPPPGARSSVVLQHSPAMFANAGKRPRAVTDGAALLNSRQASLSPAPRPLPGMQVLQVAGMSPRRASMVM